MKTKVLRLFLSVVLAFGAVMAFMSISAAAETRYVSGASTGAVYLRVSPASSENYGIISNGTAVQTIGWQRGWDGNGYTQVIYNGKTGWITSKYLTVYNGYTSYYTTGIITGADTGRVYLWAYSSGNTTISTVPNGAYISYKPASYSNGRVYGNYNGTYGWFTYKYVYSY